jgi:hypothetical protein
MSSLVELAKAIIVTVDGITAEMISLDVIDTEDWDGVTKIILTEATQSVNYDQCGPSTAQMTLQIESLSISADEARDIAKLAGNAIEEAWGNFLGANDGVDVVFFESEQEQSNSVESREEFSVARIYSVTASTRI